MGSGARNGMRGVRAAIFGTLALTLAVAAHAAAGGPLPDAVTMLGLGVPVACASVAIARRTRGALGLVVCLGAAQVVLHEGLMLTSGMASCTTTAAGHAAMPGMQSATCAPMSSTPAAQPGAMLVLHVVATLATALLLARGEALLVRLHEWVAPAPRPLLAAPAVRARLAVASRVAPLIEQRVTSGTTSRRGPPVGALSPSLA